MKKVMSDEEFEKKISEIKVPTNMDIDKINRILLILAFFVTASLSYWFGFSISKKINEFEKSKIETESNYLGNGFFSGDTINNMCLNNIKYIRIENSEKTALTIFPRLDPDTKDKIFCKEKNTDKKEEIIKEESKIK